jgi:flagella basal body P-ring formation protein FlgA
MFEADRQWLAPTIQPATAAQAIGAIVRGRVEAGKVVMAKDVEPPIIVKKGDLVSVDCIAGTVVVGTTARAKENGTDGQVIEFQSLQSKKTFQARINGNGRAVMVIPGENDQAASTDAAVGSSHT